MATRKKPAAKSAAKKTAARATTKKTVKTKAAVKTNVKTKVAAKSKAKTKAVSKVKAKTAAVAKAKPKAVAKTKAKTTAKKTVAKKPVEKRSSKASSQMPVSAITQKQTKAQIIADIAEMTDLGKPEVKKVFSALKNLVERHVKAKGSGEVTIPELGVKIRRIAKKATKARMGRNPFTGEDIKIAAKPARKSVKATALKLLKELA